MKVQSKQRHQGREPDLASLLGGKKAHSANRFIGAFKRLYDASGKTLNRVEDALAALEYRRLLCQYNLTRSELRFISKEDRGEKVAALRGKLRNLDARMEQVKESVQGTLALERWDQIIGAVQDHKGWHHLDHPDSILGNRTYHSLGFVPSKIGHEDLNNPYTPKFTHARRVFCRQQGYGPVSQYLVFLTGHPGLVEDRGLEAAYSRDRKLELTDLLDVVQGRSDDVVDLLPPGMPVIALGTQSKTREGNSHSTGRRRPYSWTLDNDQYKAPLYYNLGERDQALTWFGHWRHITSVAATPRKPGEARVLWETSYDSTANWDPKLNPEDSNLEGWKHEDWELVEVKEQLRLRLYETYDDIDRCSVTDPQGTEHVWHTPKELRNRLQTEAALEHVDLKTGKKTSQRLPSPRWAFEIVRYGILQNHYDPNVRTLVPVSLRDTRGWRWHLWLKDVTQTFCDQLYLWTKEALRYVCQGKDDTFSNLVWWNRPRLIDAWHGKDHKSLGRNVPWKQWFEPHLPLLKLRKEQGLFGKPDFPEAQRTKPISDPASVDYLHKVQAYDEGLIRYYEPDWSMPVLDPDCDPEVLKRRRDQGWYSRQSEYEIQLASLSGTWSQLKEDSRRLQEDPQFAQVFQRPRKSAVKMLKAICGALASASFARAAALGPTVPAKKKSTQNQEPTKEAYWKRQGATTGGSLPNPGKESLLLMGLLFQRGPP